MSLVAPRAHIKIFLGHTVDDLEMSGADCGQCVGSGVIDRLPRDTVCLRHTYASLCVAVGVEPAKLSGRMRHAYHGRCWMVRPRVPLDDASEDMAALGR
jgi:hypothetical protein